MLARLGLQALISASKREVQCCGRSSHPLMDIGLTRFAGVRCGEAPRANDSPSLPYGLLLREHGAAATCSISQLSKEFAMTVLRQRMTEDMQVRNLSPNTQASYLQQVSLFARYFDKSPEIRTYQIYMTNKKKLAPSSIHTAMGALRFLYRVTLKRPWSFEDSLPLPKKPQKLPVVLSPEAVVQ